VPYTGEEGKVRRSKAPPCRERTEIIHVPSGEGPRETEEPFQEAVATHQADEGGYGWHDGVCVSVGAVMEREREGQIVLVRDGTLNVWEWEWRDFRSIPARWQMRGKHTFVASQLSSSLCRDRQRVRESAECMWVHSCV
jgi:hypothetical protein